MKHFIIFNGQSLKYICSSKIHVTDSTSTPFLKEITCPKCKELAKDYKK